MKKLILPVLVLSIVLALGCGRQNKTEETVDNAAETTENIVEETPTEAGREKNEGRATVELIRRLEKRVVFTDEQKASIKGIAAQYDFDNLPKEQRREVVQKIIAKVRAEVLTPEQVEIMKEGMDNDGGGGE